MFKQLPLKNVLLLQPSPGKLKAPTVLNVTKLDADVSVSQGTQLLSRELRNVLKSLLEYLNGANNLVDVSHAILLISMLQSMLTAKSTAVSKLVKSL